MTSEEWMNMIDRVELEVPSQAEMAAYITAKYIGTDETEANGNGNF